MDESLNWSRHVKTVLSKMSRYVGIMYNIKKLLPLKVRLQIYHSFIQSNINYCSLLCFFFCKSNINAIFSRIYQLFLQGWYTPRTYKILKVHYIIAFNAFLIMGKIRSFPSSMPPSIVSTITTTSPILSSKYNNCESYFSTGKCFILLLAL